MAYIIPAVIIFVIVFALVKRINVYDGFCGGIREALELSISLAPALTAIFMMCALFEASGLSDALTRLLSPAFGFLGIPQELTKLVLIKPFSGSGSTALLSEILNRYGADSYIARCACVAYGSSETVFYVAAVYFASVKEKKLALPIAIALFANLLALILGCLLCRIL